MLDYARKAQLLNDGTVSDVKNIIRSFSAYEYMLDTGVVLNTRLSIDEAHQKEFEYRQTYQSEQKYLDSVKIINSGMRRATRLRSRIEDIIPQSDSTFITLTFSDSVLASTSEKTRKAYVERYLKEQSNGLPYVANIDFGKDNNREHYHAVCAFRVNPKEWHKYGGIRTLKVRKTSKPIVLAKYVSKLTNHGIKETGKQVRIIYSR